MTTDGGAAVGPGHDGGGRGIVSACYDGNVCGSCLGLARIRGSGGWNRTCCLACACAGQKHEASGSPARLCSRCGNYQRETLSGSSTLKMGGRTNKIFF